MDEPLAVMAGNVLTGPVEVTRDPAALDADGVWVVVAGFEDAPWCVRFARRRPGTLAQIAPPTAWGGLGDGVQWRSSLDRDAWISAVHRIRGAIADGELDQMNLTRRCSAPLPADADIVGLGAALAAWQPAPFDAVVSIPSHDIRIASASPELFLALDGDRIRSSPIKGTAVSGGTFPAKDYLENRLVTAMVLDELASVCAPGSVRIHADCVTESHPGLDHLVSTVEGTRSRGAGWAKIFEELAPPASVTGTPRPAARGLIDELEPVPRGLYCGTVGIVDNERRRARLNVAIRTFWFADETVHFGTGAGITAGSDPAAEWEETELKARRLLSIATAPGDRLEP